METQTRNTLRIPRKIAGYEVIEPIGKGGMGMVFKAQQLSLDRSVALKVLSVQLAESDPAFVERFVQEAKVAAKLNHPHIVQPFEVGQCERTGLYFFAMEYVDGPNLKKLLKQEGKFEERRALEIAHSITQALVCADEAKIVHRDIKPANILINAKGVPKLADLGVAKRLVSSEGEDGADSQGPEEGGKAVGTPYYMAPEQVKGLVEATDIRSDLYGLGATLYHLLTGQVPFKGDNKSEIMQKRLFMPPPDPRDLEPSVSVETSRLVQKLMEIKQEKRYQTPSELLKALDQILTPKAVESNSKSAASPSAPVSVPAAPAKASSSTQVRRKTMQVERAPVRSGGGSSKAVLLLGLLLALGVTGLIVLLGGQSGEAPASGSGAGSLLAGQAKPVGVEVKPVPVDDPVAVHPAGTEAGSAAGRTPAERTVVAQPGQAEGGSREAKGEGSGPAVAEGVGRAAPEAGTESTQAVAAAKTVDLEALRDRLAPLVSQGKQKEALELLKEALAELPEGEQRQLLGGEQKLVEAQARIDQDVRAGVARLKDGRVFRLVERKGEKIVIGKGQEHTFAELRDDKLYYSFSLAGGKVQGSRGIPLGELSHETRYELAVLTVTEGTAEGAALKLRWAYLDLARLLAAGRSDPAVSMFAEATANSVPGEGTLPIQARAVQGWLARVKGLPEGALEDQAAAAKAPAADPQGSAGKAEKPEEPAAEPVQKAPPLNEEGAGPLTPFSGKTLTLDLGGEGRLALVLIPAGTFFMGSPAVALDPKDHLGQSEVRQREAPRHKVTLTKPFYMGVCEVTQAQYKRLTGANPSKVRGENCPVTHISWKESFDWCRRASSKSGYQVTLPTEAQWEYACLAGGDSYYLSWEKAQQRKLSEYTWNKLIHDKLSQMAWFQDNGRGSLNPVAQRAANAWNLYDMHGNVMEWCLDWYAPYSEKEVKDPGGAKGGEKKVVRGGCSSSDIYQCRAQARDSYQPGEERGFIGFRVVVPADEDGMPRK